MFRKISQTYGLGAFINESIYSEETDVTQAFQSLWTIGQVDPSTPGAIYFREKLILGNVWRFKNIYWNYFFISTQLQSLVVLASLDQLYRKREQEKLIVSGL